MNPYIPLAVAIPLGGAFLAVLIPGRWRRLADLLALVVTGVLVLLAGFLLFQRGDYWVGNWPPRYGNLLVLDGLSAFMLAVLAVVSFAAVIYSVRYMDRYTARGKFYGLFLLMVTGMNGVVLTGDMFNFYVFLEIASIASYALVAFGCEHEELEASFKYGVLGSVGSILYFLGIGLLYMQMGVVNMADLAQRLSSVGMTRGIMFAGIFIIVGLCIKAALVPFHAWLPDAHPSAPAPISAMLSGLLIKALGIYALARIIYNVFGAAPQLLEILVILGVISMVVGVLLGPVQSDFKRLLAYCSISQMGYIAIGLGLGTPLGLMAGLFHLANHAVFKSLLFLSAGAVQMRTGTRDLHKMGGLARRMPVTAATYFTGAMSIGGVPPFSGFFSKLLIILACVEAGRYGAAGAAVIVSIITLGYFLKVQKDAFFGDDEGRFKHVKEVPLTMSVAMILLALLCLALSGLVIPGKPNNILRNAASALDERSGYRRHLGPRQTGVAEAPPKAIEPERQTQ